MLVRNYFDEEIVDEAFGLKRTLGPQASEHSVLSSRGNDPWAVVLAGGDGTRLQGLTLTISADCRPKQFCSFFGGKSLLSQTRERLDPLFRRDRRLFVVTRAHQAFYRDELQDADDSCMLVQPQNRGTGVAIAAARLRIQQREADPLVAFFPCDHFYSNEDAFALSVRSAISFAGQHPKSIVLLGAEARYPEVEYGWIEPGPGIRHASSAVPLLRENRFWEKPSLPQARALLRRGCLWNTFVTIGQASAFLALLRSQIPDVVLSIANAVEINDLDFAYRGVRGIDFSREVLAPRPSALLVVRDNASGWTDLGSPTRVIDTLVRNRITPAWLSGSVYRMNGGELDA